MKKAAIVLASLSAFFALVPAFAQRRPAPDTISGTYQLRYRNVRSTLDVQKLRGGRVRLALVALLKTGGLEPRNGVVEATVPLRGNRARYEQDSCRLDFHWVGNRVSVREKNVGDCGFGAFVTAQGTYRRVSREPVFSP